MTDEVILITGGVGYIGSHIVETLIARGSIVVVIDNLSNGRADFACRFSERYPDHFVFHELDITDPGQLSIPFGLHRPSAVIHLAALKNPGESLLRPQDYHTTNVTGTQNVLDAAAEFDCQRLVFSSSAAVYGNLSDTPAIETQEPAPAHPYGNTKLLAERAVENWAKESGCARTAINLRYFNPCGWRATLQPQINEACLAFASFPEKVRSIAEGNVSHLEIYGKDHDTPDGSCMRDFVHIEDIVDAHICALKYLRTQDQPVQTLNIGSGKAMSVLTFVDTFRLTTGFEIPCRYVPKRPGDVARSIADISKARRLMGWGPVRDFTETCRAIAPLELF